MDKDKDNEKEVKIEFEWERILEDDNAWDALFVKINDGAWVLASWAFGIEDEKKIREIILNDKSKYTGNWW